MNRRLLLCGLAGAIWLAGCGGGSGGGGGSQAGTPAGSGRAAVLLTDDFNDSYSQVWATIYEVDAIPQSGGSNVVLYSNTTGDSVDLTTLHDGSGQRFSFLGTAGIPAGIYTGLKITIGPTMQLFPAGSTTGTTVPVSTTIPVNSSGDPVLALTFKKPKTVTTTVTNVVIDFNLANFVIRDSQVVPSVQDSDGPGDNDSTRQNLTHIAGTVSSLTGTIPTLTFTLTPATGSAQPVVTTASTAIYGASLANGSVAVVFGTLDTTTSNFVAARIVVLPAGTPVPGSGHSRPQFGAGVSSAANATAGTFTLTLVQADGFTPTATTTTVATTANTAFYDDSGATLTASAFFTALATTPAVIVQGSYDSTSNTLTATSLAIDNPANDGGWETGHHNFRPGANANNWGNGCVHGHGGDH